MIPERPRLHPRCHVLHVAGATALRLGRRVLQVEEPERAELAERVLRNLDGRPVEEVLDGFAPMEKLGALFLLDELAGEGLLVAGGPAGESPKVEDFEKLPPAPELPVAAWDVPVAVAGSPRLAGELLANLARSGLRSLAATGGTPPEEPGEGLWLLCLDVPDLASVLAWNRWAVERGHSLLAGFPLGGELVVGPIVVGGRPPCLRCLVLRFLGMAPSIPVERAFHAHLAGGAWRGETLSSGAVSWLAAKVAREALEWIGRGAGEPAAWLADLGTGSLARHRLVAHPACEVCARPAALDAEEVRARWEGWRDERGEPPALEAVAAGLDRLTDLRVGLVAPAQSLGGPRDGGLCTAGARFAVCHPEQVQRQPRNLACGFAPDLDSAKRIARIEGLERYSLSAATVSAVAAAYEALGERALLPSDLPLHSERQSRQPGFPYAVFRPDLPLTWVWGYSLSRATPVLVPEETASALLQRPRLFAETSSGVAAHVSRPRALLSAALELVERDAFMIHWLLRLAPPRLDGGELGSFERGQLESIGAAGYTVALMDLSLDLRMPVVAAFGHRSDGRKPALLVGAGCALQPAEAARKAVSELAAAVHSWIDRPWELPPASTPEEVRRLDDHGAAYAHPQWLDRAAFLWSSERSRSLKEMEHLPGAQEAGGGLAALVEELRRHGLELIAVDLTTRDVAPSGLHVVRAVVPGLQPLGFGPFGTRLGGRRVYALAEALGRPVAESELNPDPHCFP